MDDLTREANDPLLACISAATQIAISYKERHVLLVKLRITCTDKLHITIY